MTLQVLLAVVLASGAGEFEIQTLDGRTATGAVVDMGAAQISVKTPEGNRTFELETLAAAVRRDALKAERGEIVARVELVDRSQLAISEFVVTRGVARINLAAKQHLEIPARLIRWVRFDGADDKQAKEWSDITDASAAGDLLVTRKGDALDSLEGTIGDIDAETCKFEVDKEMIAVKRSKIAGIVYFHAAPAELVEPIGFATTADGSHLAIRAAALIDGVVKVSMPAGAELNVPLDQIARFDFSSGKIVYLGDLDPQSAQFVPLVGFKEDLPSLSEYYRFRRDSGFDQAPLRTSGKTYRKGLALATRTVLSYKLPGKFRAFKATAGIDDSVRPSGSVNLSIKGDGKTLWQSEVRGSEPAQELEVDISGVKRLEISADYGDDLDVGDRLDLGNARVTK